MRPSITSIRERLREGRRSPREPRTGRHCPHCNGTGQVIIRGHVDRWPCFRDPDRPDWGELETRECGVCGGDGVIDRWDDVKPLYDDWCSAKVK